MDHIKRLRPSPAMIVAIVALVLSLGGTSYAAIVLPANSVGTTQIKKKRRHRCQGQELLADPL